MSSNNNKKRAASPASTSPGQKRFRITACVEEKNNISNNGEPATSSVKMHSKAVAELFPEQHAAMNGRVSPCLPSEMTQEQQLAVAVARFRPLDGPLPAGFDLESLPVYRAPISHTGMTVDARPATPTPAAEEPETVVDAVEGPTAAQDTPEDQTQTCHWAACTKSFSGFNAPTLLYLHLTNEHVKSPIVDPDCEWAGCSYSTSTRRHMVSHVGVHVPKYRPFVCEECGAGFKRDSHLVRHRMLVCNQE